MHGQGTERDCAVGAVFSKFPNVLTIHGNMRLIAEINKAKPFSFLWLAAQLEKVALPRTRGVVCITNYTREAVKDLAVKTWVVPNAVDEIFFEVQSEPDDSRTVLVRRNDQLSQEPKRSSGRWMRWRPKAGSKVVFLGDAKKEDP